MFYSSLGVNVLRCQPCNKLVTCVVPGTIAHPGLFPPPYDSLMDIVYMWIDGCSAPIVRVTTPNPQTVWILVM